MFYDEFGNHQELNIGQEYLWQQWVVGISQLPPIDILALDGDLVDGKAPGDKAWAQMTTNVSTQHAACAAVSKLLRDKVKDTGDLYVIEGTRYHESADEAEALAERLEAKPTSTGLHARPVLRLKIGKVYVEIRHKISGAKINTSTALQSELRYARAAAIRKGYTPGIIVGSHWHRFGYYGDAEGLAVAGPGFELLNRFAEKARPSLWMPDIGFLWITIYPDRGRWGQCPLELKWILSPHPKLEIEEVEISGT